MGENGNSLDILQLENSLLFSDLGLLISPSFLLSPFWHLKLLLFSDKAKWSPYSLQIMIVNNAFLFLAGIF